MEKTPKSQPVFSGNFSSFLIFPYQRHLSLKALPSSADRSLFLGANLKAFVFTSPSCSSYPSCLRFFRVKIIGQTGTEFFPGVLFDEGVQLPGVYRQPVVQDLIDLFN